ncbi:MAG TPA: ferritin family protein [Terriglobales bacterium]
MKRPFTSLTPQEALHVAIFIEERNAAIYHRFAEMFVEFRDLDSLEIAGVFWDMAVEENHHSTRLLELYNERFGNTACSVTEEDIVDIIEVPKLEDGDVFGEDARTATARERALQVALAAELNARKFYAAISDQTTDPKLRRLYKELAEFEGDHVDFLERKVAQTAAGNDTKSN